ncbi:hypothetical protein K504DRAFT_468733 [Pleomassaria siparia CBS 279.74]|uniref:Required for respiratory growth protein 9, mitochondrial n=1 Tax=Pleomassaria siparia CBS 279.74 TaxID=1314801 RepID=A0A6G1K670_9PLEO|nr:hypothetical protein K504DRAFT_468733 [Pleomassaria siparia CBS 279.74]
MHCPACPRQTLSLFIRSFTNTECGNLSRSTVLQSSQAPRSFSSAAHRFPTLQEITQPWSVGRRDSSSTGDQFPSSRSGDQLPSSRERGNRLPWSRDGNRSSPPRGDRLSSSRGGDRFSSSRGDRFPSSNDGGYPSRGSRFPSARSFAPREPAQERTTWMKNTMALDTNTDEPKQREHWQIQKAALKEKLNGEAWNPRKKLSPDTQEGIRHLHQTYPDKFTTAILAQHFQVSPEAIRRILKSKWRPSDEEQDARKERWDKRGERIWSNMVELGLKPPKRWREMGVGSSRDGSAPRWKTRGSPRNTVHMNDSHSEDIMEPEDIIPVVYGKGWEQRPAKLQEIPLSERIL